MPTIDEILMAQRPPQPSTFDRLSGGGYGNRQDNTPKGLGYFGALKRPDGDVSTELSFDFTTDGRKVFAPLLVPSLSKAEIDHLLSGQRPTEEIFNKAQQFALERLRSGKPTFALPGETYPVPGTTDVAPLPYRNMLRNTDPMRRQETQVPNAYGGQLQPEFGPKSMPQNYSPTLKRRI